MSDGIHDGAKMARRAAEAATLTEAEAQGKAGKDDKFVMDESIPTKAVDRLTDEDLTLLARLKDYGVPQEDDGTFLAHHRRLHLQAAALIDRQREAGDALRKSMEDAIQGEAAAIQRAEAAEREKGELRLLAYPETIQQLQAQIGRLQMKLHHMVCGDPRGGTIGSATP